MKSESIPPSKMEVHYFQMWNHSTSTIAVPEKYKNPFNISAGKKLPRTSLEILQTVLHGDKYKAEIEAVEVYMQNQKTNSTDTITPPSCLLPDTKATRNLASNVVEIRKEKRKTSGDWTMPLPVLNVGYPKCGTSTLNDYFNCIGIKSVHEFRSGAEMFQRLVDGLQMYSPTERNRNIQAYTQIDTEKPPGYFPQVSLLDELHEEHPNSTFVFIFRRIPDWIESVRNWNNMRYRLKISTVPGLIKTKGFDNFDMDLAKWWCGHVLHIREYLKEYPSHALIELDLYNTKETDAVLFDLFQADSPEEKGKKCWGKSNANPRVKKQE